jgi:hypothetical protein
MTTKCRYTLGELFQNVTLESMAAQNAETTWAREGEAVDLEFPQNLKNEV